MSLSPELLKLIADKKKAHAKSGNVYKLKEGKNRIRILPGWRKDATNGPVEQFWHDFGAHYIKDAKGQLQAVVGCVDAIYQKPCEFCDAINASLKATTDDDTVKLLKEWKSNKRVYVNALVRTQGSDKPNEVQVVELAWSVFGSIVTIMEEYAAEYGNMLDAKTGIDFIIEKAGKGLDTKYTVLPAPKSDAVDPKLLANVIDLDAFVAAEVEPKLLRARNAIAALTGGAPSVSPAASRLLTAGSGSTAGLTATTIEGTAKVLNDEIPFDGAKPVAPASAPASGVVAAAAAAVTAVAVAEVVAAETQPAPAVAPAASSEDDEINKMLDELKL
jgi:hypothetical protein